MIRPELPPMNVADLRRSPCCGACGHPGAVWDDDACEYACPDGDACWHRLLVEMEAWYAVNPSPGSVPAGEDVPF